MVPHSFDVHPPMNRKNQWHDPSCQWSKMVVIFSNGNWNFCQLFLMFRDVHLFLFSHDFPWWNFPKVPIFGDLPRSSEIFRPPSVFQVVSARPHPAVGPGAPIIDFPIGLFGLSMVIQIIFRHIQYPRFRLSKSTHGRFRKKGFSTFLCQSLETMNKLKQVVFQSMGKKGTAHFMETASWQIVTTWVCRNRGYPVPPHQNGNFTVLGYTPCLDRLTYDIVDHVHTGVYH